MGNATLLVSVAGSLTFMQEIVVSGINGDRKVKHFVGIGHSHLHAVTWAWREEEAKHPESIRYTAMCILDAPFNPAFTDEGGIKKPNPAWETALRDILNSGDDVSIFLFLGGSEAFRWSLTPGPCPFDFVDPHQDDGVPLNGQIVPYELVMTFARHMFQFIDDFVKFLRTLTSMPLVQINAPPPARDLPAMVAVLPEWSQRVGEFGVSPLSFRTKMWRAASRALEDVCAETGIAFMGCPPEALDPRGGLRDDMVGDVVHGNVVWGRMFVQSLMHQNVNLGETV
jgi:hypothetical protein